MFVLKFQLYMKRTMHVLYVRFSVCYFLFQNCWAFCSKPSEPDENNGIKKVKGHIATPPEFGFFVYFETNFLVLQAKEIFRRIRTRDTLKLISYERRKRGPQKINAFNQVNS